MTHENRTAQPCLYQQLRAYLAVLKLHDAAEARRLVGRLRFAALPTPATLVGFDDDAAPGVDQGLVNELATCRYLETATNVLLIGPPGTGKTHPGSGSGPGCGRSRLPHLDAVDRRYYDRSCVHVQTSTRTLSEHRALPQLSDRPSNPPLLGNPRIL
ncbi:hypothetical protein BH11ACT1_BH11ACT1_25800 [soil metagenome]